MNHFEDAVTASKAGHSEWEARQREEREAQAAEALRLGRELVDYIQTRGVLPRPILREDSGYAAPSRFEKLRGITQGKYSVGYTRVGEGWVIFDGPEYVNGGEGYREVYGLDVDGGVFSAAQNKAHPKSHIIPSTTLQYNNGYDEIIVKTINPYLNPDESLKLLNSDQLLNYLTYRF